MSEEKKQLSLSDLGVEAVATPAEQAQNEEGKPAFKIDKNKEVVEEAKPNIIKPGMGSGISKDSSKVVRNVNDIASKPITQKENPIRKTLDGIYELADKNIDRTKKQIMPRIEEGKREYIDQKWKMLEARAKKSSKIAKRIEEVNNLIDTDARFDDIDDYLRHGYILSVVAHDSNTGIDPRFFGSDNANSSRFRNSADANDEIEKMTSDSNEVEQIDIYDDDSTMSLNKDDAPITKPAIKEDPIETETISLEIPSLDDDDIADEDEDDDDIDEDSSIETESIDLDEDEEEESIDPELQKKIIKKYKSDIESTLNTEDDDIDSFVISDKAIKLKAAINRTPNRKSILWGLQYSGTPIEITPFSGEDLIALNPQQTDYTTISGLRTVFSTLYRHLANPHKPQFEDWLKQISDSDVDCLLFAVYVANFKDTNILTHECPNPKCGNVFIKKYKINDIMVFPNEKVKARFNDILHRTSTANDAYRTKPITINHDYAVSFVTQSVYSTLFEPMSLSEESRKKYNPILSIMPVVDTVYKIDRDARVLIPISFGKADTIEKSVLRKIKGLAQIMKKFTPDERSIMVTEASKVVNRLSDDKISYQIPETVCPLCGRVVEARKVTPLDLLFMRAQLPIIAASISE